MATLEQETIKFLLQPEIQELLDEGKFGEIYDKGRPRYVESISKVLLKMGISAEDILKSFGATERNNYDLFYGCNIKKVVVPDNIRVISEGMFHSCTELEEIVIPDNVLRINRVAFFECTNLKKVIFGKGLQTIEDNAFVYCKSLKSVDIPKDVFVQREAFRGCESLETASTGYVSNDMFWGCTLLEKVNIENPIDSIGFSAFRGCDILKEIKYNGTRRQFEKADLNSEIGGNVTIICNDETFKYKV